MSLRSYESILSYRCSSYSRCERFIEAYRAEYSVKLSVNEQVSRYRQYRDELAEVLQTHPVWIEAGEEAQFLGAEGIEYMTMNQIHAKYFANLRLCGANTILGLSVLHIRMIAQRTRLLQRNFTCSRGLNLSIWMSLRALKLMGKYLKRQAVNLTDLATTPLRVTSLFV